MKRAKNGKRKWENKNELPKLLDKKGCNYCKMVKLFGNVFFTFRFGRTNREG